MKKAQILSAIALAFALGVVAPVAGVYTTGDASAFSAEDNTATRADLDNAVKAVEANATYKAIATVATEVANTEYADENGEVAAVLTALDNGTPTGVTAGKSELANPTDQQIIDAAKKTTNYSLYVDLKAAVADDNLTTLKNLILNQYNKIDGVTAIDASTITDASAFNLTTLSNWSYYNALITAVSDAQEAVTAETNGIKNLTAALKGALNETGKEALKALEDANNVTVATLKTLATDTNIDNYTKWVAVQTAVKGAEPNDSGETAGNYTKLMAIATAYKTATNNLAETAGEIAASLAAYVAPINPKDPTNPDEPTDPTAPGTGVVSAAEGNASTTISLVAGLATALTALGAGVVAYRSARRSNK